MRAGDTVFGAHHAVLMRGECASTLWATPCCGKRLW